MDWLYAYILSIYLFTQSHSHLYYFTIYKSLILFSSYFITKHTGYVWIVFNHKVSISQYLLLKLKYVWERVQKTSKVESFACISNISQNALAARKEFFILRNEISQIWNISSPKGASSCKTKEPSPGFPQNMCHNLQTKNPSAKTVSESHTAKLSHTVQKWLSWPLRCCREHWSYMGGSSIWPQKSILSKISLKLDNLVKTTTESSQTGLISNWYKTGSKVNYIHRTHLPNQRF